DLQGGLRLANTPGMWPSIQNIHPISTDPPVELFLVARQRLIQALVQFVDLLLLLTGQLLLLALADEHLVADVQGRHHGNALQAYHLPAVADVPHGGIQMTGSLLQVVAFFRGTGDLILPVHNTQADGEGLAHESCSRDFERSIMASSFWRARSFFSISCSRSSRQLRSCAWSCRFCSCSRSHISISRSTFSIRVAISGCSMGAVLSSRCGANYRAARQGGQTRRCRHRLLFRVSHR